MKLKFTLEDIWDLEDDISDLTEPVGTEQGYTEEKDGVIFAVYRPRYVFPRLGVAFYQAEMLSGEDSNPVGGAVLMYKQDERDLNKYEDYVVDGEMYDLLNDHFKSRSEEDEVCVIDLDEVLTKEQQEKLKSEKPDLDIWNYLVK